MRNTPPPSPRMIQFASSHRRRKSAAVDPPRPDTSVPPAAVPDTWFAEEVLPHEAMLRAWLRQRFPTRADVDDLVQESYMRLLRARVGGQVRNARNYLFATARNAALDLVRRERCFPTQSIEENSACFALDGNADVAETVGRNQELEILRSAMQALPDRCRQVFTLRKLYGLSHREIAAQLGISERTVEAQINKAMLRCAAYLRAHDLP